MKSLSHFRFSRSQRSGIFFLGACVVVLQLLIWNGIFSSEPLVNDMAEPVAERFEAYMDSLQRAEGERDYSPKPFNPNFMSDHRGYMFGMTPVEIDRFFDFREKGNFVKSAEEFQKVTGIHDSVLARMSPYFSFPRFPEKAKRAVAVISKADINLATPASLQKVYGIGPVLAERIVAYRERLGGFCVPDQLTEVYGLKEEVLSELWRHFHLDEPAKYGVKDINMAGLEELSAVPYISSSLAAKIVAYRSVHQRIDSMEELTKIHDLSEKDLTRIQLYLKVE